MTDTTKKPNAMTLTVRARQAEEVLNNPAYQFAFDALRKQIIRALDNAQIRDKDGIQLTVQQLQLVDRLQNMLTNMVRAGDEAQEKLKRDAKKRERIPNADLLDEGVAGRVSRMIRRA